jgi:hypothetical protein
MPHLQVAKRAMYQAVIRAIIIVLVIFFIVNSPNFPTFILSNKHPNQESWLSFF